MAALTPRLVLLKFVVLNVVSNTARMDNTVEGKKSQLLALVDGLLAAVDESIEASNRMVDTYPGNVHAGFSVFAKKYNDVAEAVVSQVGVGVSIERFDLESIPDIADTVPLLRLELIELVRTNLHLMKAAILETQESSGGT